MTSGAGRATLRCRWLVTGDRVLEHAWIGIGRGRITAFGRGRPPRAALDLGDAIVVPGLVNAHTHLEFSDCRQPLDATGGLPAWIGRLVAERRGRAGGEAAAAIASGLAESAAAGVTAIGDIATVVPPDAYAGPGPAVRAFREGLGLDAATAGAVTRDVVADLDRLAAAGVAAGVSPHAPYSVTPPLGRALLAESRRRGLPVAMHLLESDAEAELLATGAGPLRRLLEELGAWDPRRPPRLAPAATWIGWLARSPRGIVVHATHVGRDPAALDALARHRDRLAVVVCPRTTRALSGLEPPIGPLAAAGVRVAIGTDSRASNPDLSVLAECRAIVDTGLVSPREAIAMATVTGAWALGIENRAGTIRVGRSADLVVLRPAAGRLADPFAAALDPATAVAVTLRRGRAIAGRLT